ncbi:MAG: NADH:flavin oxidoreductase [Candidatus Lindowbacteria bacterium]|nr:NADH:flavin oxidoreductase [Candidatus Lindowbacteria bacterium]
MPDVFGPVAINRLRLPNRFVRSATYEGLAAEDGRVTDALVSLYEELARGEIGLIVVGYAYIQPNGKGGPGMLGIWSDEHIEGLARLTEAAHEHGAKIASQIVHCGRQTLPDIIGGTPVGPSPVPTARLGVTPRELTVSEIEDIIANFGKAAARAKTAGFDAVQIHCAHGYLLNQFLAKNSNQRIDTYGGSIEGRARALFETYARIRDAVGADYPVLIKMNCADFVEGGLELEESLWVAEQLARMGIDAIEVSGGVWDTVPDEGRTIQKGVPRRRPEAYFLPHIEKFKKAVGVPVIAVGGIRVLETAQSILREGKADLISMCRPFIHEPHLLKRWRSGDLSPAACVSCNRCLAKTPYEGLKCFGKKGERGPRETRGVASGGS